MMRCKVYEVGGSYLFDMESDQVPEKDTALIMPDGRYLNVISVRRNLKYNRKYGAYRCASIDIVISDYGGADDE